LQVSAHGTGATIPTVDEQVVSLKLVTPGRGTIQLSEKEEPELFRLAKVGLGLLGVVTEVTLQCVDAHQLLEHTFVTTVAVITPVCLPAQPSPFMAPYSWTVHIPLSKARPLTLPTQYCRPISSEMWPEINLLELLPSHSFATYESLTSRVLYLLRIKMLTRGGVQEVKKSHGKWLAENRHMKYLWIPYTDAVVVVKNNPVPEVRPLPCLTPCLSPSAI
jgi:hypothetical protein